MLGTMVCHLLYTKIVRPLLFRMDCEDVHHLAHRVAQRYKALWPLLAGSYLYRGNDLSCQFAGIKMSNPVGLAAGFDKNGDLVDMIGQIGFGFTEIGSVTGQARAGNPKPRLFRLPEDHALINRLGLNGEGADQIAQKLKTKKFSLPVGLNIAKTNDPAIVGDAAIEDMLYTFRQVKNLPLAYITVNASCPNTHEGIVTETSMLDSLFALMQRENESRIPILVKLSPDASKQLIEDIVLVAIKHNLAGYVCGNTSTSRTDLTTAADKVEQMGNGGLSGPPLKNLALKLCQLVWQLKAPGQVIIGCGGITSGEDAYEFIGSGASIIQIYTGLVYEGPTLPKRINQELSNRLKADGLTLSEAVGKSVEQKRSATSSLAN
jgi:dihydroorotate dehydrogenase